MLENARCHCYQQKGLTPLPSHTDVWPDKGKWAVPVLSQKEEPDSPTLSLYLDSWLSGAETGWHRSLVPRRAI